MKYKDIKDQLNCTMSLISYHCKNAGLAFTASSPKLSSDMIKEMQKVYDEGQSLHKIAKLFNISFASALKYIETRKRIRLPDDERKKNTGRQQMSRRRLIKQKLVEYKGGKCERCGYDKCIRSLHFHHVNPNNKIFTVSEGTYSWEKFKNEADKCELVCANCHGEIEESLYNSKNIKDA